MAYSGQGPNNFTNSDSGPDNSGKNTDNWATSPNNPTAVYTRCVAHGNIFCVFCQQADAVRFLNQSQYPSPQGFGIRQLQVALYNRPPQQQLLGDPKVDDLVHRTEANETHLLNMATKDDIRELMSSFKNFLQDRSTPIPQPPAPAQSAITGSEKEPPSLNQAEPSVDDEPGVSRTMLCPKCGRLATMVDLNVTNAQALSSKDKYQYYKEFEDLSHDQMIEYYN